MWIYLPYTAHGLFQCDLQLCILNTKKQIIFLQETLKQQNSTLHQLFICEFSLH